MNKLAVLLVFSFILLNGISQNILLSTDFQQGIPSAYSMVNNDNFTPDASMTDFLGQNAWIVLPDPENPSDTVAAASRSMVNHPSPCISIIWKLPFLECKIT
jgi:hypothetical protein